VLASYSSLLSVGVEGICQKLKVDLKIGLTGEDFP
jgi:hypothetical protein